MTSPIAGLSMPGAGDMTWIGYPPTWAFFQAGLYHIFTVTGSSNRFVYYFLLKQPMIIADVICAFLLLWIVNSYRGKTSAIRAFGFWLLCPFTVIISSMWGMFDQIILIILLTSVLLSRETRRSALLSSLGFILKVIPLIYIPVLAFSQSSAKKVVQYLIIAVGVSVILCLAPYLAFNSWNVRSLIGVGADVAQKRGTSLNYWILLFLYNVFGNSFSPSVSALVKILSYAWIPAVLYATYFCSKAVRAKSADTSQQQRYLFLSVQFITLIFFLTKTVVNEQYAIYFIGFGLIDYYVTPTKTRRRLFHLIWIVALAFLIANNTLLVRFFEPLSTYYQNLSLNLTTGLAGTLRYDAMAISAVLFSIFCLFYLGSLYSEIRSATFKEERRAIGLSGTD